MFRRLLRHRVSAGIAPSQSAAAVSFGMTRLPVRSIIRCRSSLLSTVSAPASAGTSVRSFIRAIAVQYRRSYTATARLSFQPDLTAEATSAASGTSTRSKTQPSTDVTSLPHTALLNKYLSSIQSGKLRHDPRQDGAIIKLNNLFLQYLEYRRKYPDGVPSTESSSTAAADSGSGGGFFRWGRKSTPAPAAIHTADHSKPLIQGLYIYGGVGSGKTMLMDMFYDQIPETKKVRRHFHSFMLDIHARLHAIRVKDGVSSDPLPRVAREFVASEARLLCLDEFQVTDVADAMILQHLFGAMFKAGCVVIATSNRNPDDLYKGGINRPVFMPFIGVLKKYCVVHAMESGQDHRLLGTLNEGVYHYPLTSKSAEAVNRIFDTLSDHDKSSVGPRVLDVMMGRKLHVPIASKHCARFTFPQLCETALGAADYIALAKAFPNLILTDIPIITFDQREKLRRFINLLDILYEQNVRLIITAAAPPAKLFQPAPKAIDNGTVNGAVNGTVNGGNGKGNGIGTATPTASAPPSPLEMDLSEAMANASIGVTNREDESFASTRAVSRLIEMQSVEYLERTNEKRARATI